MLIVVPFISKDKAVARTRSAPSSRLKAPSSAPVDYQSMYSLLDGPGKAAGRLPGTILRPIYLPVAFFRRLGPPHGTSEKSTSYAPPPCAIMPLKGGAAVSQGKESGKARQLHNVHDKSYKELLGNKRMFLQLLTTFLTEDWVRDIDEDDLVTVNRSFIPRSFRDKRADIVYRLRKQDIDVIFYVLLELQSTVDFSMPIRLLSYMTEIWWKLLDELKNDEINRKDFRLPAIIPMVLYNGPEGWTAKRNFKEIQSAYQHFGDNLLDFRYVLFDVHRYSDPELREDANVIASVFFLDKRITLKEAVTRLGELADVIKRFPTEDFRWFIRWVKHSLLSRLPGTEKEKLSRILSKITPQEVDKLVSNLGLAVEDALRDAKTEAKTERSQEIARNMLLDNEPAEKICKFTGLPLERIEELKKELRH